MHLLNFLTGYRLTFKFKSTHKYKIRGTKFRVKFGQNLVVESQICKTLFALRREIKKQLVGNIFGFKSTIIRPSRYFLGNISARGREIAKKKLKL